MKPTMRNNGKMMLTITVKHHLTLTDLIAAFLSAQKYEEQTNIIDNAKSLSKADIMKVINDELWSAGENSIEYNDSLVESTQTVVTAIFNERFKEFN